MPSRDVDPDELQSLTEVFRRAGAIDPESWARSQLAENIPQLAIFSFAKALWNGIIREDEESWIKEEMEWSRAHPSDPCAQMGPALEEMLAKNVSRRAIIDLVRVMQYSAIYHACMILDGARVEDVPITDWLLHQIDEQGSPTAIIQGLHEVLLGMDPAGREMRPRNPNLRSPQL